MIIDILFPDVLKLITAIHKEKPKADAKDFEKMASCSKYRYSEYIKEKNFGMAEDFYVKMKLTPDQRVNIAQHVPNIQKIQSAY